MKFLQWLKDGPKPWIEAYGREQRNRYYRWEYITQRTGHDPAGVAFITGSHSADTYVIKKMFYYVKRMRYIVTQQQGNRLMIALTDRGRQLLFQRALEAAAELKPPWVVLVLFDVPEQARGGRDALRHFLKIHGFRQLQLSAWYSTRDCQKPLQVLINFLGAGAWVTVARAECPSLHY